MRRKEKEIIKKTYFPVSMKVETCGTTLGHRHFKKMVQRKTKKKKQKRKTTKQKENKQTSLDFFYFPNPYLFFPHFFKSKNAPFPHNFLFIIIQKINSQKSLKFCHVIHGFLTK